jgi:hypothetical protein
MTKATPEEIVIIKRIAAIENITHKVESRWNAETDREEDCDCFYVSDRRNSFEWCSRYNSFEDFIRDYAQFKYDSGYQVAASW